MPKEQGTILEIGSDIVARVSAGLSRVGGSIRDAWFGPLEPLTPVAPPETQGRQFDYMTGYNLQLRPRSGEAVTFQTMRTLADAYDLLRLVIETRKDQIEKLEWKFVMREEGAQPDERCKQLTEFFLLPDREHDWPQWLRMLLEDMFVIDAATIYPRMTKGGQIYGFELIDGSTIKRVLDPTGRTPMAPEAAYQQVLKGVPAVNYTADELLYRPRNIRTNKVYGYSPVEQVIVSVNIALQRQASQMSYYTHGSTPDLIIRVPPEWNPDQIAQFDTMWHGLLQGNLENRRRTMFVPGGVDPVNTKEAVLKDQYDEWLARVICYAFSVSPQPFIKEMNRSTAQTNLEASLSEGLRPIMNWVQNTINLLAVKWFNYPDIKFQWNVEDELSAKDRAGVHQVYANIKALTPDEIREELGRDPLTPEEREAAWPTPPALTGEEGDEDEEQADDKDEPPEPKEKIAKKKLRTITRNRKLIRSNTQNLRGALIAVFGKVKKRVITQLDHTINRKESAVDPHTRVIADEVLRQIDLSGFSVLRGKAEKVLKEVAKDGAAQALDQINVADDKSIVKLANERAEKYARDRSANLVGMKWVEGELIPNPNPEYRIDEATREMLRSFVEEAIAEGYSNDQLSDVLSEAFVFSDERAEMIARTETAAADVAGNMEAYRSSGVVSGKQWIIAQDEVCDECQENADQGVIDLDDEFISGEDAPPAHPNCRCDVIPVLNDQEE